MKKDQREQVKLSLLTVMCNVTQIYRGTIPKDKKKIYTKTLKILIKNLIGKIDINSLANEDIRKAIKDLSIKSDVSIGASQKAINVYLKFYCILANKSDDIIKELDCPIDSFVIKENKLSKVSLKNMNLKDYEEMQDILKENYGIKLLADIKAWDDKKIY